MGFFSNIFKKKKGGTFVGNLIRGAASTATGGVLGSGAGLARWEAEQDAKVMNDLQKQIQDLKSYNGKQVGSDLVNSAINNGLASKQTSPNMGESIVLTTLKKHWMWFLGAAVVLVGVLYYFASGNKKGNSKFRFKK